MSPKKKTISRPAKSSVGAAQGSAPSASADGVAAQAGAPPQLPLIGVRHTSEPLSFRHHFGHEGGVDPNMTFNLRRELLVFRITEKSRVEQITKASHETLRILVTDARFENLSRKPIIKPAFLFGDFVDFETGVAYDGDYKWLWKVGECNLCRIAAMALKH